MSNMLYYKRQSWRDGLKKNGITKETNNIDELVFAYHNCKDEKKRRLIHIKIIKAGIERVKKLAAPFALQTGVAFEDLVQVGALGLIKSIDSFAANKNAKFSTYATYYIKGELRHYIRDKAALIKTPRKVQELIGKICNATKALKYQGIMEPTTKDIADYIDLPLEKVEEVIKIDKFKFMISLDQSGTSEEEDSTLLERIPYGDYQEIQTSHENKLMVEAAINKLPIELKQILELSFYEELSQREIAGKLEISQMQVSRRLKKALNEMYEIIRKAE